MPRESSAEERMTAVAQAHTAFRHVRTSTSDERGRWLVGIAEALEEHRSALVAVADEETALGAGRLNGELESGCTPTTSPHSTIESGLIG
jgi:NADP-dependent aldehyde dehydrogenase